MWWPVMVLRLLMAHAFCDFVFQTDAMAKGKNRNNPPPILPPGQKLCACWPYWLSAHALIAGAGVWLATGVWVLGLAEVVAHWGIDFIKCEGYSNPHMDQMLHLVCRIGYVAVLWEMGVVVL